ncbi:RDD family protein [Hymenobacter algoricola]|uniref:RDD domain-containing protein n=1 Tax=Hymenobacter algoricola TaxID=486267 RepID=A0ABP7NVP7_9BACT
MEASKTRRFLNWLIDSIGVFLLLTLLVRFCSSPTTTRLQLQLASMSLLFVYYAGAEFFFQRSVGKLLTHTLVVSQDDERPSLGAVLLRTVCRFIPLEPLSLLLTGKRVWHDTLSGTKVVFIDY